MTDTFAQTRLFMDIHTTYFYHVYNATHYNNNKVMQGYIHNIFTCIFTARLRCDRECCLDTARGWTGMSSRLLGCLASFLFCHLVLEDTSNEPRYSLPGAPVGKHSADYVLWGDGAEHPFQRSTTRLPRCTLKKCVQSVVAGVAAEQALCGW